MSDTSPKVTEKDIHDCIDSFLDLCTVIDFEQPSKDPNADGLTKILEATFRKNIARLRAVHLLIDGTNDFASPALEITRNMLEDAINIEFIIHDTHDEEEVNYYVERFFDFQWVQLFQDLQFYKSMEVHNLETKLLHRAKEIENQALIIIEKYSGHEYGNTPFASKNNKGGDYLIGDQRYELSHSWLRNKGFEKMLKILKDDYGVDDGRLEMIARAYVIGSRSTHFNPASVLEILQLDNDKYHGKSETLDSYTAFLLAGLSLVWILRKYLDGIPPSELWSGWDGRDTAVNKVDDVESTLAYYLANITKLPHNHSRSAL